MELKKRDLQKRLLAYSATALALTAGATQALPLTALESDGANYNDFDIVFEKRMFVPAASNCKTVIYSSAATFVSINEPGFFASAYVSSFGATTGTIYVWGSNGSGSSGSTTTSFVDHGPGTIYNELLPAGPAFVYVTLDRNSGQFCIDGPRTPTAISGATMEVAQSSPTGLMALVTATMAGLSGWALWVRNKGKSLRELAHD